MAPGDDATADQTPAEDRRNYEIREYRPGDAERVVDLHNRVWNGERTTDWFHWKYVENPAIDRVPVYVATCDGTVVGTVGLVAFRMCRGETTGLGLLAGDLVVHPDHRRQGLFTRLFTAVADAVTAERAYGDATFLFAYANASSFPGTQKLGWTDVSPRVSYYRVHDPRSYLRDQFGPVVTRVLGPVLAGGTRTALRLGTRGASSPADVTVERHERLPVETLTTLAASQSPEGVRPRHDAAFYEWRFAGVSWRHDAVYVAERDGEPIAATVTRVTRDDRLDATTVSLVHTVPLAGESREDGLAAILDRVVADYRDTEFLRAWNPVFPDRLLRERGFLADDRPPLSLATESDLQLVVRSTSETFPTDALRASAATLWSLDK